VNKAKFARAAVQESVAAQSAAGWLPGAQAALGQEQGRLDASRAPPRRVAHAS